MAVTYGIYEGISCGDGILAVAVLSRDDYSAYYRDNIGEYLDYLLGVEEVIEALREQEGAPYRQVRFLFDRQMFEDWLLDNPQWQNTPVGRAAWAYAVAADAELLAQVQRRNPVLPAAPVAEKFVEDYCLLCVPAVIDSGSQLKEALTPLPQNALAKMADMIHDWMRVPPFEYQSAKRCSGLRVIPANRFVTADRVLEVINHLQKKASPVGAKIFVVPDRLAAMREDEWRFDQTTAVLIPLLLPVVLQGGAEDVDYACDLLVYDGGEVAPLTRYVRKALGALEAFRGINASGAPDIPVTLLPLEDAWMMIDAIWEEISDSLSSVDRTARGGKKAKERRNPFKRIK